MLGFLTCVLAESKKKQLMYYVQQIMSCLYVININNWGKCQVFQITFFFDQLNVAENVWYVFVRLEKWPRMIKNEWWSK